MASYDLVVLSHLRWDFVWQRPQHLMSHWAREHRVFFIEEPVADEGCARLEVTETPTGVYAVTPHVAPGLDLDELDAVQQTLLDELFVRYEISSYVLWFYAPMAVRYTAHLRPLATVYDCMDELSMFAGAPPEIREREQQLLRRAEVVFTGGHSLYRAKAALHRNVHAFPSSVDAEYFRAARNGVDDPPDQASLARPRLGYFGVVDERMDVELLYASAELRPEWEFIVIGPVVKIDPGTLPGRPNLHYLGPKRYEQLPAYLRGWDVAIMPFARNAATRFISPTKTLEYLAAGKPVVSTPIADVVQPYGNAGLVHIAEDASEFVAAAERALTAEPNLAAVDAVLAETSWERTFAAMKREVDAAVGSAVRPAPRRRGFDVLVVGAGFGGSVTAERLAAEGYRVLVVDKRNHIGGNAFDHHDDAGILVHRYGPHIFHTNAGDVFEYLSRFTDWRPYEHRVRASVDGRLVPLPINLDTINELYGLDLSASELEEFFASRAERVERPRTSEDVVVSKVGRELYVKFFRNYTRKQWGLDPSELDASVTARVPVRTNRDDRYFSDTYQAMPKYGYTKMFEAILDHANISVLLQTDWREVRDLVSYRDVVYSGPVDEFFEYRFGRLPYRSLEFRFETHENEWFQPAPVVNYPNEHPYTRCTEFKWLTGQVHPKTTVVYEVPRAEGDPYYPVPRPENAELYKRYKAVADTMSHVWFVGRLATYRYYNMDQVVGQALVLVRKLVAPLEAPAPKLQRAS